MPTILNKSTKISLIGSSPLYPDFLALFALSWARCQHDLLSGLLVFASAFSGWTSIVRCHAEMDHGIPRESAHELCVSIFVLQGPPS